MDIKTTIITSLTLFACFNTQTLANDVKKLFKSDCAVLVGFGGNVEILDETRTSLKEVKVDSLIPCGSWISVLKGWAIFEHRDGYKINLGQWSFMQFLGEKENDTVTLYRGMILSQVPNGSGHFSVITSNARAYFKRGTAIVLYSQKNEETELVTLENSATLENRFQSGRKILAKEGEITVLNFKAKRVVPSLPQAVTLLAAKEKLNEFNINEDDQYSYLQNILKRQKRKFASHLSPKTLNRKIASPEHYLRHPTLSEDESTLIHEMVRKNVAGDTLGEKMLFPEKAAKRAASIRVNIEEVKEGFIGKDEIAERKRLIEELSQIRPDE